MAEWPPAPSCSAIPPIARPPLPLLISRAANSATRPMMAACVSGPGTGGAGANCNATLNLDGGTLTVARIFQGTQSGGGIIDSTFNFNGGTLKVLPGTIAANNFMAGSGFRQREIRRSDHRYQRSHRQQRQCGYCPALAGRHRRRRTHQGRCRHSHSHGREHLHGPHHHQRWKTRHHRPIQCPHSHDGKRTARLKVNSSGSTPSSLGSVSLNSGSGLELDLGAFNAANQPALAIGTLNAIGNYTIDLSGVNIPASTTITLLTYTTKTGSGTPVIGTLPTGVSLSGPPVDYRARPSRSPWSQAPPQRLPGREAMATGTPPPSTGMPTPAYSEPAVVTFPTLVDAGGWR